MIFNSIDDSITNSYLKNLSLHLWEYECTESGYLISNDVPTIHYLQFKIIKPATRIGVSNLKYKIDK